jgi:CRP/FNR family transcriptional regulator, dissimilatory nitrate respiration regulator
MDFDKLELAPLFRGLTKDEIKSILDNIPHKVRKFRAGSMIAQIGDIVSSLMIVVSGTVKGEMVDYAGRTIKIEDIPAPGAIASAFIFGNKNRFPVNVLSVTESELLLIEKSDFMVLLMKNTIVLINFMDMISNRSQFLSEKIKFLNFKTIKGKLAHFILQKSVRENLPVNLGMTQNDLADFFGVARPSIARALGDMEESGLILAKGKNIIILNRERLSELTLD